MRFRLGILASLLTFLSVSAVFPESTLAASRRASGRVAKAQDLTINGKPAVVGTLVRPGDRLKTGSDGMADVVLADGVIFRLFGDSTATVPQIGRNRSLVRLIGGSLMSLVGRPMAYRVQAPKAVAAVSGTVFFMKATQESPSYVCACSGKVNIGPPGGAPTLVDAGRNGHIGMMVTNLGFNPAGPKDHNDGQLMELAEELEKATGILNRYKNMGGPSSPGAGPGAAPGGPGTEPVVETEPSPGVP